MFKSKRDNIQEDAKSVLDINYGSSYSHICLNIYNSLMRVLARIGYIVLSNLSISPFVVCALSLEFGVSMY